MPEIPEVENIVRDLISSNLEGKVVMETWYSPFPNFVEIESAEGRTISQILRRGKTIVLVFDDREKLYIGLGMTGKLKLTDYYPAWENHLHGVFRLDDGRFLSYIDPRRFGYIRGQANGLSSIGPEYNDSAFNERWVSSFLAKTRRPIKAVLLDQRLVAGVGNYLADEILYSAKIHPNQPALSLTANQIRSLIRETRRIIEASIAAGGNTMRDYRRLDGSEGSFSSQLRVYGRGGEPCGCGATIEKTRISGRGTSYCPREQVLVS